MALPVLLSGLGNYKNLAAEITACFPLGFAEKLSVAEESFPDGERYHRINQPLIRRDVVIVCGTPDDAHFLDLVDVSWVCAKNGAASLTLVVPYFGYSTMERGGKRGHEAIKAKIRLQLLSAIPHPFVSILFLDLHASGTENYLESTKCGYHKYAEPVILNEIRRLTGQSPFAIGSTDGGRSKWVQELADQCDVPTLVCLKTRESGSKTTLKDIQGDAAGLHVVIYDDMIRTGGSLIQAARGYLAQGAVRVDAVATHGVLPGDAAEAVLSCGAVGRLSVTDSLPTVYSIRDNLPDSIRERFEILPLAALLAGYVVEQFPRNFLLKDAECC